MSASSATHEPPAGESKNDYQGPHNWIKSLRPVRRTLSDSKKEDSLDTGESPVDKIVKDRRLSKDERLEEGRIRERIKAMPTWKKDPALLKAKGPVVAKMAALSPPSNYSNMSSGSVSPMSSKRRNHAIMHNAESPFTRQIVNRPTSPGLRRKNSLHNRTPIPAVEKKPSVFLAPGRRLPSPSTPDSAADAKRRIEKVMKARLYLLQQMGPNSFLIGGDSPDHKYRVIIGPQTCSSCIRNPHCVHILFVMLRVFQLGENNACLWSKTLKNFEVETLFSKFHARRSSLIQNLSKKKQKAIPDSTIAEEEVSNEEENETSKNMENGEEEAVEEKEEEEEDTCPICLLEMVEGESLTECVNCQNKLHHHCIAVWFTECRQQNERLICPLCRAQWKISADSSEVVSAEDMPVPPNTRASSPQSVPSDHVQDGDITLPHTDPISEEDLATAEPWIKVLGEELVSCLFSKNWMVREIALKQLGRVAIGSLLLGVGEGRSGVMLSPSRQATTHSMLECCLAVLAHMGADPVYKVYVAALRTMRTVLAYTPCRDNFQMERIQSLMKPVVDAILWKCADSNKRTSQLSISALQELVKGQEGELAVGKEIVNPGPMGLGGLTYLLGCITQAYDPSTVPWQWLLGRFYMLAKVLDEHPTEFIMQPVCIPGENKEKGEQERSSKSVDKFLNYTRVSEVLTFTRPALMYGHQKVSRIARRVFYLIARLQAHSSVVLKYVMDSLEGIELNLHSHLKRRLLQMAAEYSIVDQAVGCMRNSEEEEEDDDSSLLASSPHSCSPVPSAQISVTADSYISGNAMPTAPPNSPTRNRGQRARTVSEQGSSERSLPVSEDAHTTEEARGMTMLGGSMTPSTLGTSWNKVDACTGTSPTLALRGIPSGCSDVDNLNVLDQFEDESPENNELDISRDSRSDGATHSELTDELDGNTSQLDTTNEQEDIHELAEDTQEEEEAYVSPSVSDNLSVSSANATMASSSELTEDLSDLTLSPTTADTDVSFKTEVASGSPQHYQPIRQVPQEPCHCKEEVEKEEAQALAQAMEQSETTQNQLPYVPGLSRVDSQATLTIQLQDEEQSVNGNSYLEGTHWKRGDMLGTGAFSTCYQARDVKTGTLMAVKQISFCRNSLAEQERVVQCVKEEIAMMSRLSHPNIVRILGATQQGCHFFMFVEWMPGGCVASLLTRYGAFTESVIVSYIRQVLMGIAYLHDCHMLHRDLKGANLLVDSTGQKVRIGDFGASARLASRQTQHGEFQGQLLGTIAFMAPEVLRGESYGRSCDVWSIGCVMIEMATCKPPWGANDISNHLALIFRIASCTDPPPIPENLSPPVRDLLLRCLECQSDDRPPAKELLKHPLFTMTASKH